ncbi:MAG: alpha/beta fold hydrolase [Flavisolibacter sp.]
MKKYLLFSLLILSGINAISQKIDYPHKLNYLPLTIEGKQLRMAYMDVSAEQSNGKNVVLLHGKNFNGYYWKDVIKFLTANGYRVIVPDQIGFGFSDKPKINYSFDLLAANTKKLLDTLGIIKTTVIGHSMGGMLLTRFAILYPDIVEKLIYENPIGLEDYSTFVPKQSFDSIYQRELKANYETLKKYQQSYYPTWKSTYEQYVAAQFATMQIPDFKTAAYASALTYQMIIDQPVTGDFRNIKQPTLIVIGQLDRTVVGKNLLSKQEAQNRGYYPKLGKMLKGQIQNSTLVEFSSVGHIPHVQVNGMFEQAVLHFLRK